RMDQLKKKIRNIPDFPKAGILFYDITTLLRDAVGFRAAVDSLVAPFKAGSVDLVVGMESRGFIFGSVVADRLGEGFVPVRKVGKLPSKTRRGAYAVEYGGDSVEIHDHAVTRAQRVRIVDALPEIGGTAKATLDLVKGSGGIVVGLAFLIELIGLDGRSRLSGENIHVVLKY